MNLATVFWPYSTVELSFAFLRAIMMSWILTFVNAWGIYSVSSLSFAKYAWISWKTVFTFIFLNYIIIRYLWLFSCYIYFSSRISPNVTLIRFCPLPTLNIKVSTCCVASEDSTSCFFGLETVPGSSCIQVHISPIFIKATPMN